MCFNIKQPGKYTRPAHCEHSFRGECMLESRRWNFNFHSFYLQVSLFYTSYIVLPFFDILYSIKTKQSFVRFLYQIMMFLGTIYINIIHVSLIRQSLFGKCLFSLLQKKNKNKLIYKQTLSITVSNLSLLLTIIPIMGELLPIKINKEKSMVCILQYFKAPRNSFSISEDNLIISLQTIC